MKKIKTDKKYLLKRANAKWEHELDRKKKRKIKKHLKLIEKIDKIKKLRIPKKKIKAPTIFSFIENTDEIIDYFNWYLKYTKKKMPIEFDLKDIEQLTFDSISILLANIKDKKYSKSLISWNAPEKIELKNLFIKSDFYSFVNSQVKPPRDFIQWRAINHISNKQVSPEIAWEINEEFINMNSTDKRKLYEIIIECMQNTMNHAWEWFNWWIFYYNNKERWTKEICFLDLWVWILWSLNTKFEDFADYIKDYNKDKLKQLFEWEWKKQDTITKERKRWNWLKDIYKFAKVEAIKNFVVITNQIKADLKNDNYVKLKNNFEWTFYYWEI
ncbi:MAG: hypothetical protein ACD_49C00083G0005 [uncultured bacterium (gcode 4)]|uniref:Uncharacterized protein n=1 Tax=uncultured bacterium (gcode 4) TaxID=1234023 RepID=K2BAQ2_9BACT|nr:MAG: hypothetical protein ACD_49C00083G0005 [uncultured bacterium (gcode 4)]